MFAPKQPGGKVFGEINVTPLVDVCLVLLIIFMVVTPLIDQNPISLPRTDDPSPFPGKNEKR